MPGSPNMKASSIINLVQNPTQSGAYSAVVRDFRPHRNAIFAAGLVLVFIFSWSHFLSLDVSRLPKFGTSSQSGKAAAESDDGIPGVEAIQNSTLGFQRIFALALPDRRDRIKPLVEGAKASNLSITVLNAVYDKEIDRSAWPKSWDSNGHANGELGCVVSHVRTWNKMVAENIESAIVLESDADWDLRIHDIFTPFPRAIKRLIDFPFDDNPANFQYREDYDPVKFPKEQWADEQEMLKIEEEQDKATNSDDDDDDEDLEANDKLSTSNPDELEHPIPKATSRQMRLSQLYSRSNDSSTTAPYRTHTWDILWTGHCGSSLWGHNRIYAWRDPSTTPEDRESSFDVGFGGEQHVPGTRAMYEFSRTTCSAGYAISLRGAKKLVEYFGELNDNLDIALSRLCHDRGDMICVGVWPQIFSAIGSESNIEHPTGGGAKPGDDVKNEHDTQYDLDESEETGRNRASGPVVQFSARKNSWGILRRNWSQKDYIAEWNTMFGEKENGTWGLVPLNRTEAFTSWGP